MHLEPSQELNTFALIASRRGPSSGQNRWPVPDPGIDRRTSQIRAPGREQTGHDGVDGSGRGNGAAYRDRLLFNAILLFNALLLFNARGGGSSTG